MDISPTAQNSQDTIYRPKKLKMEDQSVEASEFLLKDITSLLEKPYFQAAEDKNVKKQKIRIILLTKLTHFKPGSAESF